MPRELLPNRRDAETFSFEHRYPDDTRVTILATLGFYKDGRIGEVFFATDHNVGSHHNVALHDACILLSFNLQHGCAPDTLRKAMTRDAAGRPEGVMGTLIDLICSRWDERVKKEMDDAVAQRPAAGAAEPESSERSDGAGDAPAQRADAAGAPGPDQVLDGRPGSEPG